MKEDSSEIRQDSLVQREHPRKKHQRTTCSLFSIDAFLCKEETCLNGGTCIEQTDTPPSCR